jgi:hypothetical protein
VYNQAPIIYAATGVGTITPFKNWLPEAGYHVPDNPTFNANNAGSIGAGGNVRTMSAALTATVRYANSSSYSQYKDPSSNSDWGKVFSSIVNNQGFAKLIQDIFSNINMGAGSVSVKVINVGGNSKNIDLKDQEIKLNEKSFNEKIDRQIKSDNKSSDDSGNKDKKTATDKNCDDKTVVSCKN